LRQLGVESAVETVKLPLTDSLQYILRQPGI